MFIIKNPQISYNIKKSTKNIAGIFGFFWVTAYFFFFFFITCPPPGARLPVGGPLLMVMVLLYHPWHGPCLLALGLVICSRRDSNSGPYGLESSALTIIPPCFGWVTAYLHVFMQQQWFVFGLILINSFGKDFWKVLGKQDCLWSFQLHKTDSIRGLLETDTCMHVPR